MISSGTLKVMKVDEITRVAKQLREAIAPLLECLPYDRYDLADEFLDVGEEGLAISSYLALADQHGFALPGDIEESVSRFRK